MDTVYIRELSISTTIGIYDWEREIKQTVKLDIEMAHDIRAAALADDIALTLDYHAISKRLISFIEGSEFLLIETMAEQSAALIQNEFAVPWLRLTVSKPGAVPEARDVGVTIERGAR